MKVNFDAAFDRKCNLVSACLIHNDKGDILGAWIERDISSDAFVAEIEAILAFKVAKGKKL